MQLSLKARADQTIEVANQDLNYQDFKFEVQSAIYRGPIYSVSKFSEFIGVELDLAPKREFVPHNLFYKCAKLQE
jgi:hypothetical protein